MESELIQLAYLVAASFFIIGIRNLGSPATARKGNKFASFGMLIAVIVTLLERSVLNYPMIIGGIAVGGMIGLVLAKKVQMTSMPQLVGLFNGFGGGASALVAAAEFLRLVDSGSVIASDTLFTILFGVFIGGLTLTGSLIAFGKLQGLIGGSPITFPLQQPINALLMLIFVAGTGYMFIYPIDQMIFFYLTAIALILGVLMVIPIGGADMPVVISLLNSLSGVAASAAGFVLKNNMLIIAGALVGASGLILTNIMCKAMNRSLFNVIFGAFGQEGGASGSSGSGDKTARSFDAEEAAPILAYARTVIIVPGYGMAAAQAQHAVRELADELEGKGVTVKYAIHPVAGRMPGHMNVLLAEANVPYSQLYDMDDINPEFDNADVALIIGANDVVNPAAREDKSSPIYGMPILNVDKAKNVMIIKRSLSPGFAGIDNDLFYMDKTMMLFGSAKEMVSDLLNEVKQL